MMFFSVLLASRSLFKFIFQTTASAAKGPRAVRFVHEPDGSGRLLSAHLLLHCFLIEYGILFIMVLNIHHRAIHTYEFPQNYYAFKWLLLGRFTEWKAKNEIPAYSTEIINYFFTFYEIILRRIEMETNCSVGLRSGGNNFRIAQPLFSKKNSSKFFFIWIVEKSEFFLLFIQSSTTVMKIQALFKKLFFLIH
jgi:hypothetical protein